jgi:hypothetical protein
MHAMSPPIGRRACKHAPYKYNLRIEPTQSVLLDKHIFRGHGPELFIDTTYREVS